MFAAIISPDTLAGHRSAAGPGARRWHKTCLVLWEAPGCTFSRVRKYSYRGPVMSYWHKTAARAAMHGRLPAASGKTLPSPPLIASGINVATQ